MEHANGEFLLFLDADDWLESNYLVNYLDAIILNPDCVASCSISS